MYWASAELPQALQFRPGTNEGFAWSGAVVASEETAGRTWIALYNGMRDSAPGKNSLLLAGVRRPLFIKRTRAAATAEHQQQSHLQHGRRFRCCRSIRNSCLYHSCKVSFRHYSLFSKCYNSFFSTQTHFSHFFCLFLQAYSAWRFLLTGGLRASALEAPMQHQAAFWCPTSAPWCSA